MRAARHTSKSSANSTMTAASNSHDRNGDAPPPPPEEELPAKLSLTLDEAKEAIRAANGDVIQVGFLAGAYRRSHEEDPRSGETRAARAQLCDLVAKRLKDRKLLAPDGIFELGDEPGD
jgi:hypothetical protein